MSSADLRLSQVTSSGLPHSGCLVEISGDVIDASTNFYVIEVIKKDEAPFFIVIALKLNSRFAFIQRFLLIHGLVGFRQ